MYFDEDPGGCGSGQQRDGWCEPDLIVGFSPGVGTLGTHEAPRTSAFDLRLRRDPAQQRWVGEGNPCAAAESSSCDPHASCRHTGPGLHECTCLDGYEGNGGFCQEAADSGSACEQLAADGHATTGACAGGEPCYGDVDRDGDIDVGDLLELLSDFGAGGGGPSDLDVSGVVDVADLLAVLSRFGAAC